jgi:hypothetical protein
MVYYGLELVADAMDGSQYASDGGGAILRAICNRYDGILVRRRFVDSENVRKG